MSASREASVSRQPPSLGEHGSGRGRSALIVPREPPPGHSASGHGNGTFAAESAAGLRLALFCDSYLPQINGVSLLLQRLVDAVRRRGGAVRVYTTSDPAGADTDDVRRWPSVAFWAYPEHRMALPTQARVRREIGTWRPTLIHAASPFGMGLAARAAARAMKIPFVSSYHTNWSAYSSFYQLGLLKRPAWWYLRWFHNGSARTYAPTHAVESELLSHGFTDTALWGRGVDAGVFNPAHRSSELRRRLGVDDQSVLAIYVGRLGAEKRLDVALRAMQQVSRDAGHVRFAIAGDGPFAAAAHEMAPPGTTFMGRLTGRDLSEFYASADIFVFPSTTDTFGNVLLEAMASGLAVVGADVGPTRELLSNGHGVTFPAGDSEALGRLIIHLAASPEHRRTLAEHALAFARQSTWDSVFDSLVADYLRVVAEYGSLHAPAVAGR